MNRELERASKALDDFLEKHPELQRYQDEIERRLGKAPTFESKMAILKLMMSERLSEMQKQLLKLSDIAKNEKQKLVDKLRDG